LYSIDFRIELNETVAIIGSNGAGKSTLLKSIIGLVRSKTGEIYFNGRNMTRNPEHRIVGTWNIDGARGTPPFFLLVGVRKSFDWGVQQAPRAVEP